MRDDVVVIAVQTYAAHAVSNAITYNQRFKDDSLARHRDFCYIRIFADYFGF